MQQRGGAQRLLLDFDNLISSWWNGTDNKVNKHVLVLYNTLKQF